MRPVRAGHHRAFLVFKAVGLLIDILHGADQQHRRMDYIGKSFIAQGLSTLAAFVAVFWSRGT